MTDPRSPPDTQSADGKAALERISTEMYAELRALARSRLRRSERVTLLDTTALVHDTYLRLVKAGQIRITSRGEFMAYAARVMRSVIVDLVRERNAERRGGEQLHITLDTAVAESVAIDSDQLIRVHDALTDLEKVDPRLVQIVEMRFFGGFSDAEIAQHLGVAERTVRRHWEKAKLMLGAALQ